MTQDKKPPYAGLLRGWAPSLMAVTLSVALAGCGGGSMFGGSTSGSSSSSPSIGSRFSQLFGSKSQAVGEKAPDEHEPDAPTCPQVSIRFGASTLAVGLPGKEATGADLRYQASILRTARDCTLSGGQIHARLGVQGRIIVGQAGAPPTTLIPMRVAVVQEGVSPKVIFTKAFQTTVDIQTDGFTDFSLVAEDIVYPPPSPDVADAYVFYVGFDPSAMKPEPKAKAGKKKH
jgi:hypothetical protein